MEALGDSEKMRSLRIFSFCFSLVAISLRVCTVRACVRAWPVVGVARLEKGEPLGGEIREGVSNRSVNEDTTLWQREMIGGRGDLDRLEGIAMDFRIVRGSLCVLRESWSTVSSVGRSRPFSR